METREQESRPEEARELSTIVGIPQDHPGIADA